MKKMNCRSAQCCCFCRGDRTVFKARENQEVPARQTERPATGHFGPMHVWESYRHDGGVIDLHEELEKRGFKMEHWNNR